MEDRLRKFAQVIDHGGFSSAARSLHISQPALTTAVQKLERELGTALLDRKDKIFALTPAGEEAYRSAKGVNNEIANLKQRLAVLKQKRPLIRLGMIDSLADILFSKTDGLSDLQNLADISLMVNNSQQLTLAIAKQELEAAFIVKAPENLPKGLTALALGHEPLSLVMHVSDRHMYQDHVARGKLPNFLSYNIGSRSQYLIEQGLSEMNIKVKPTFYSTSPEIMLKMMLARQGITVLPFSMVKQLILDGTVATIPIGSRSLSRPIYAIHWQVNHLPPALSQTFALTSALLTELRAESAKT